MTKDEALEEILYYCLHPKEVTDTLEHKLVQDSINDVLDRIREEINRLTVYYTTKDKGRNLISQNAVNRILDKYQKIRSEELGEVAK